MTTPFLSIIIPCYNSAAYIEATLESLAKQNFQDFEIIIVDDESSDGSIEVANKAIEKYNLNGRVLPRPASLTKGVANCRNAGIKTASAHWVSFLDSDDLFSHDKALNTVDLIKHHGSSCHAFFHAIREFEDGTNKTLSISENVDYNEPKDISDELIRRNIIATSSVTVKKSLLENLGGFDSTLHGVEDYLLWLRVSKKSKWFYSGKMWTDYRIRKSSLMGKREMTYYITQNVSLLKSAKSLNEFTSKELASLEASLFDDAMQGYALISLNSHGWGDFTKGLFALSKIGKRNLASRLLKKHLKNLLLKKMHQLVYFGRKNK